MDIEIFVLILIEYEINTKISITGQFFNSPLWTKFSLAPSIFSNLHVPYDLNFFFSTLFLLYLCRTLLSVLTLLLKKRIKTIISQCQNYKIHAVMDKSIEIHIDGRNKELFMVPLRL